MLIQYERDVPLKLNKKKMLTIQEKAELESNLVLQAIDDLLNVMDNTAIYSNFTDVIRKELFGLVQKEIDYFDVFSDKELTHDDTRNRKELFRLIMSKYNIK